MPSLSFYLILFPFEWSHVHDERRQESFAEVDKKCLRRKQKFKMPCTRYSGFETGGFGQQLFIFGVCEQIQIKGSSGCPSFIIVRWLFSNGNFRKNKLRIVFHCVAKFFTKSSSWQQSSCSLKQQSFVRWETNFRQPLRKSFSLSQ